MQQNKKKQVKRHRLGTGTLAKLFNASNTAVLLTALGTGVSKTLDFGDVLGKFVTLECTWTE